MSDSRNSNFSFRGAAKFLRPSMKLSVPQLGQTFFNTHTHGKCFRDIHSFFSRHPSFDRPFHFFPFWQTDLSERIYFKGGGGRGSETAKRRDLTNLYGPTTANTPSSTSPSDYYSEIRKFRHPLAANSIYRPRRVGLKSVVNL